MPAPDISRNTFDSTKDYVRVLFQQKKPVLDAELNELQDIRSGLMEEGVSASLVNGPLGDSFDLEIDSGNTSDFTIARGVYFYYGQLLRVRADTDFSMALPVSDGYWTVYLEASEANISEVEDPDIKDPSLPVTAWRVQRQAEVKIIEGQNLPVVNEGVIVVPLWQIARSIGVVGIVAADLTDQRYYGGVNYVFSGGLVQVDSGLDVTWSEGDVLQQGQNKKVSAGSASLPASSTRVIYFDENLTVQVSDSPQLTGPNIPFARVTTDAADVTNIEDLRPLWSMMEFRDWEDDYAERNYPFQKGMSLTNSDGRTIPKTLIRDLRIWNGNIEGTYYVYQITGSRTANTLEIVIANSASVMELLVVVDMTSADEDGLIRATGFNDISGESCRLILDSRAVATLFPDAIVEDVFYTFAQTVINLTNVAIAPVGSGFASSLYGSGGVSLWINNWRETNKARDYPIQGTSTWLRSHIWDFILNGARTDEIYYVSCVSYNHPSGDYITISAEDIFDRTTREVLTLEVQGVDDDVLETWVTANVSSIWQEVAKASVDFSDTEDAFYQCYNSLEGRIYPCNLIPAHDWYPLCAGDGCVDVAIDGLASTGFGGTEDPIPILIDSNCLPDMVGVSFAEVCWCYPGCDEIYYDTVRNGWGAEFEDCVEICPGTKDCGVWYLEWRQSQNKSRVIRIQYSYVGHICEGDDFKVRISAEEACGTNCFRFSYLLQAPGRTVDSVFWTFGDGNDSVQSAPSNQYGVGGTYTVTLAITLDDLSVLTETVQVIAV